MSLADDYGYLQGLVEPTRITEGITNRQMAIVLKDASKEAQTFIASTTGKSSFTNLTRSKQLAAIKAGIDPISTELWTQTGKLTEVGMFANARLAVDQAIDRDFFAGMPGNAAAQYARDLHIEASAGVQSVLSRRTNGYTLSERIYANGQRTTAQVGRIVERGLVLQRSAREIAGATRKFFAPNVPGGASYAAMRLARTEINNAHHHSTIRQGQLRPWVLGFRWNLSNTHPVRDPCDDLAEADNGMGPGIWDKRDAPDRPHPQCLCYLTVEQLPDDQLIDNIANGQYDDWLEERGVTC